MEDDEPILTWKDEAAAVIKDIKDHVQSAEISTKLLNNDRIIYLNVVTLESKCFCIEMNGRGFRIVGTQFDDLSVSSELYFETPYSLLTTVSAAYIDSFGRKLIEKLENLNEKGDEI